MILNKDFASKKQITLTNIKGENYGKYIIWWKL